MPKIKLNIFTNVQIKYPNYMNSLYFTRIRLKSLSLSLITLLCLSTLAWSQAPTGLTYPTPVVYNANVNNVFLSPNVAGNVSSYSMPASPALPAGLSFDPNTGIISGMPTAAVPTTNYTITAHNASGSTSTVLSMTVANNYLNNANQQLHFGGTGVTIEHYPTGSNGQSVGDITVYKKITTLGGQNIDCIVTTKAISNVTSWQAFDQADASGSNFSSNSPDFFAPQISFSSAGNVTFDFQFILGNSYNSVTKSGINIVLQDVKLNTYDIDGNGGNNSFQYNEFGGFQTSELLPTATGNTTPGTQGTTRVEAEYIPATGLTRFTALNKENSSVVTAPETRVRVSYANMSKFTIVVGAKASGLAFFFLDFSAGSVAFTNAVVVTSPSVDLNKATTGIGLGVDNEDSGCGDATSGLSLAFTIPSETNVQAVPATLRQFDVSFDIGDILNGTNEKLTVGSTDYTLNVAAGDLPNITVGGATFKVKKSVSGSTHKFEFTNNSGSTFTVAQAEALLDALKYKNNATTRIAGSRKFTVNVFNTDFKSPDAVFTASINCVAISGHIWRDANGLNGTSDFNTISANSPITGQLPANGAYAILVNTSTNQVIASKGIDAGGAYSFGNVSPGTYTIYVSNEAKSGTLTEATPPAGGYVFIGENLGAGAGNDLSIDGKLIITVGSEPVTNANFGLDIAPVANNVTADPQANPGGTQKVTVPTLNGSDPEDGTLNGGTGNTVKIISLPAPSEGILYYDGIEVSLASPIIENYDPSKLKVDPVNGNVTVTFTYQEVDAAGLTSPTATVTMPFTDFSISGKVYHDVDGKTNMLIDGTLISSAAGSPLHANLVIGGIVVGTYPITDGAYTFTTGNGLQTNTSSVIVISTVQGIVGTSTGATSVLPNGWAHTAEGAGAGDSDADGKLTVNVATSTISTGLDFGIEILPIPGNGANSDLNPGGTISATVPANTFTNGNESTDEDGSVTSIRITAFPDGATSITIGSTTYTTNGSGGTTPWPAEGVTITTDGSGNPTSIIRVDPTLEGNTTVDIPFVAIDNAGKESSSTGHAIMTFTECLISLGGTVYIDNTANNGINGTPVNGTSIGGSALYVTVMSGVNIVQVAPVQSNGKYLATNLPSGTYKLVLGITSSGSTAKELPDNYFTATEGGSISDGSGSIPAGTALGDGTPDGTTTITADCNNIVYENLRIMANPAYLSNDFGISSVNPLPVVLVNFDARASETSVNLTWTTSQEKDFSHFEVQRAEDGKSFKTIANITGSNSGSYHFTDANPIKGSNYYRLRMVDLDGTFALSRIRNVNLENAVETKIFPNPTSEILSIEMNDWSAVNGVKLYNASGVVVYQETGNNLRNVINVKSFTNGTYILQLTKNDGSLVNRKISVFK